MPGAFPLEPLHLLRTAAAGLFAAVEAGEILPASYGFNRFSSSVLAGALPDFGCRDLAAGAVQGMGFLADCITEQCWARKKYAPGNVPAHHRPQDWHQDGALGVQFPPHAGQPMPAMARLLTCWIPLDPCDGDRPALEFIRRPMDGLLHYSELNDEALRARFASEEFWVPDAMPGDALVFLNGTLHRTFLKPEMSSDRLSLEYRFGLRR